MKRILSFMLAVVLSLTMISVTSFASNEVKITLDAVKASPGEPFDIDLILENNPGIVAANINVAFDEGLTLVSAKNGNVFPSSMSFTQPNKLLNGGKITGNCNFNWFSFKIEEDEIKNGTILTLRFELSEHAEIGDEYKITVSVRNGDLIDRNAKPISIQPFTGSVEIVNAVCKHVPGEALVENKINSTCSEKGSFDEVVYCTLCKEELSRTTKSINKIPHTEVTISQVSPTCTSTGLTEGKKCSVCGTIITAQTLVAPLDHSSDSGTVTQKATCTSMGVKTYKCLVCGEVLKTETVAKIAHKEVVIPAVEPTCIETGLTEGSKCSTCGVIIKAQTITPMTGHFDSDKDGLCDVCGTKVSEECIHSYKDVVTKAGFDKDGNIKSVCQLCGYVASEKKISGIYGIFLEKFEYEYTGTEIKPGVLYVLDNDYNEIPSKYYTVTYSNNVNIGDGTVTIKFKGNYSCTQNEHFNIVHKVHKYDTVSSVTKATLTANGKVTKSCSVCGAKKSTTVYYPKTFKLNYTSFAYNGKAKNPTVTVTDSNGKTVASTNYSLSYKNNINIGTATVKVTFKGNYSGTKSITYKIVPAQVTGLKQSTVTATTQKLSWTKVSGAKYYKVEQSTDGKKWTVVNAATTANTITVSKLKAGTKYQFRVTALDSTKKIAGKTSTVLKTQTLTTAPIITLASTKSKTATVSWKKVNGAKNYVIYKSIDNKSWTKVATVGSSTTSYNITKLTGGKKIYVKVQVLNSYNQKSAYSAVKNLTVKK